MLTWLFSLFGHPNAGALAQGLPKNTEIHLVISQNKISSITDDVFASMDKRAVDKIFLTELCVFCDGSWVVCIL